MRGVLSIEKLEDFELKINNSKEPLEHKLLLEAWKWLFEATADFIEFNETFELEDLDELKQIFRLLKIAVKNPNILPKELLNSRQLSKLEKLKNMAGDIIFQLSNKQSDGLTKKYSDFGIAMRTLASSIQIWITVLLISSSLSTNNEANNFKPNINKTEKVNRKFDDLSNNLYRLDD